MYGLEQTLSMVVSGNSNGVTVIIGLFLGGEELTGAELA